MFRFSLRTGFVVLTILCIYLGWQLSIVRARQSFLQELRATQRYHILSADQYLERYAPALPTPPPVEISLARTWLGDQPIQEIMYWPGTQQSELDRIAKIIPEAEVREIPLEPCHPGCFPDGTPVVTLQGTRPIESISAGDIVVIVTTAGETSAAEVQSVFVTNNVLWRVVTDAGELITTETQPLCRTLEETVTAGKLAAGDTILRQHKEALRSATVLEVVRTDRFEKVHNLVLGDRQLFIAGGFLARSKPPAQ
jgi:hypothetical protein